MAKPDYPVTPAIRFLREKKINYQPFLYDYEEHGGTAKVAEALQVDEYAVIKTIVLENELKKGLICLMHGNKQISTRQLARALNFKHIDPANPNQANKWTGYLVGGTSPFGLKSPLPIYAETTIQDCETIYINGGKRGFIIGISPTDLSALGVQWVNVATE